MVPIGTSSDCSERAHPVETARVGRGLGLHRVGPALQRNSNQTRSSAKLAPHPDLAAHESNTVSIST